MNRLIDPKAIALALLAFFAFALPASAQEVSTWQKIMDAKTLRIGGLQMEPWYFKDTTGSDAPGAVKIGDTVWRGIGAMVGKEIANAMGVKLEIVETTYANAVAGLQANQFDVVFALDGTPKRALAVDFVPSPLLWYPISYYSRVDIPSITWVELNDPKQRIGVILGGQSDQFATARLGKATISRFQLGEDLIAALQSGRVDGILNPAPVLDPVHAKLKIGRVLLPKPAVGLESGVAIRKEQDGRWKSFLATSLKYTYQTGEIQEIYNQFLRFRGIDPSDTTPVIRENW